MTFELRPEDNKSEPCGYLGEEHSWQHSLKQVRSQKHGSQADHGDSWAVLKLICEETGSV